MANNRQFLYPCSSDAQLCLGLGEQVPTECLFFAALPAPLAAAQLAALSADLVASEGLDDTPLARERLYVVLHHLGDYAGLPPSLLMHASRAAARLQASAFEARFDRVGSSGTSGMHKACALRGEDGVRGLWQLQRTLGRRLAEEGITSDMRNAPRLTLLYSSRHVTLRRVEPIAWEVNEIVLVRRICVGQGDDRIEGRWLLHTH